MFKKNVGTVDRAIRGVVGLAALIAFFMGMGGGLSWLLLIVGILGLGTAALGSCPPYALLGINTCPMKK